MIKKVFAPDYPRNEQGLVLFPRDTDYRAKLFPALDPTMHVAKANAWMVKALVEYVSEPGEHILDPFAGTGTILLGVALERRITCIEIEPAFQRIIESNIKMLKPDYPNIDELATLVPADVNLLLPIPNFCDHTIFSPPYANVLKKTEAVTRDKTSVDLGYGAAYLYSQDPHNISNLNPFLYHQKMESIYKKLYTSLRPGGTMTIIIKDRMLARKRERLGDRAQRDCMRLGFEFVARHQWYALGGGYSAINRAMGLETVDEEDLITFRRPA